MNIQNKSLDPHPNFLDQLRLFVIAAERGSFSSTARETGRAHSVVSYGIANLEEYLGVELFDRSGHKAVLSAAGRALQREARAIVDAATTLQSNAREFSSGLETRLTIAIDDFVPASQFLPALRAVEQRYPGIEIRLTRTGAMGAETLVNAAQAVLGITAGVLSDASGFDIVLLGHIVLVPVIAAQLQRSALVTGAILELRQIVLSGVEEPDARPDMGVLSTRIWRVSDLQSKLELILDGFGWGMMPEHLVEQYLAQKSLSRLTLHVQAVPPQVTSYLVHRVDCRLGPAAALFCETLLA
jgi:DNA-binding transcriptional LysR family regulator